MTGTIPPLDQIKPLPAAQTVSRSLSRWCRRRQTDSATWKSSARSLHVAGTADAVSPQGPSSCPRLVSGIPTPIRSGAWQSAAAVAAVPAWKPIECRTLA